MADQRPHVKPRIAAPVTLYIEKNLSESPLAGFVAEGAAPFGSLPPAADPERPTAAELEAVRSKLAEYQAVFDTH